MQSEVLTLLNDPKIGLAHINDEAHALKELVSSLSETIYRQELTLARQATRQYHDIDVVLADGYLATEECVASPAGAMGLHFVNPALIQDPCSIPNKSRGDPVYSH